MLKLCNVERKTMKINFMLMLILLSIALNADGHYEKDKNLFIVGSTSVAKLIDITAEPFYEKTGIQLIMRPLGSDKGVVSIAENVSDIGVISRYLTKEERQRHPELRQKTIAQDAIILIVNTENQIQNLNASQIANMYTSNNPIWPGSGQPANLYSKKIGHGTHDSFLSFLKLESMYSIENSDINFKKVGINNLYSNNNVKGYNKVNQAVGLIFRDKNGLAYESLGAYKHFIKGQEFVKTKVVSFNGINPTLEGQKNLEYPFKRPFNIIFNTDISPMATEYKKYLGSEEAQQLLRDNYYIPVLK